MTHRYPAAPPVLAGVFAVLCVRPAFAQDPACSPLAIESDRSVSARWPGLLDHLRDALEAHGDIDRCAHVKLSVHDSAVTVEAFLPDGRSAARSVSQREDVVPTVEALLLVPQRSARVEGPVLQPSESSPTPTNPMPTPPRSSPPSTQEVPFGGDVIVSDRVASAPSSGHRPSRLRIELSVATGARIGDGQASVGLGAVTFLDLSGWLVGFAGRADRYKALSGGPVDRGALELALMGGRRFRFQNIALDLVAGPAEVLQGTTTFVRLTTPAGGKDATASSSSTVIGSSSSTAPRLLLGARVSFGALSTLHIFVGVDGELGPRRAGEGYDLPGVPRLPVWTLGLALGATVGTQ